MIAGVRAIDRPSTAETSSGELVTALSDIDGRRPDSWNA
jgi:hypothetical protein